MRDACRKRACARWIRSVWALLLVVAPVRAWAAGWHDSAWPSTDHYRFTNLCQFVAVSNLSAQLHVEYWSQTTTAARIPAVDVPFAGYSGPLPSVAAPVRAWTNSYLTDIQADPPTSGIWTAAAGTNTTTNTYGWLSGETSNTLWTVLTSITNAVQTNLLLDVSDVWGWDCYQAAAERYLVMANASDPTNAVPDSLKPRFYRSVLDNTRAAKQWVFTNCTWWMDLSVGTNGAGFYTNVVNLNPTSLCAAVGAPTNYFSLTFWRPIGGQAPGLGRHVTNLYVIAGTNLTYTTVDTWGNALALEGTNGQEILHVATNLDIPVGRTTADYGLKYLDRMLDLLAVYAGSYTWEDRDPTNNHRFGWEYVNDYAANVAAATNQYYQPQTHAGNAGPEGWSRAQGDAMAWRTMKLPVVAHAFTNLAIGCRLVLQRRADVPQWWGTNSGVVYLYSDQGTGIPYGWAAVETNLSAAQLRGAITGAVVGTVASSGGITNWLDAPAFPGSEPAEQTYTGFTIDHLTPAATAARFDFRVTNGFRYWREL